MEMIIDFPGGARVDAHFGPFTVPTDQPSYNGMASAPTPFATFLASIGTCAGIYVLGFCQQRGMGEEAAVALIVNGFAKEVLQALPMEFAMEAQQLVAISLEGSVG